MKGKVDNGKLWEGREGEENGKEENLCEGKREVKVGERKRGMGEK